MYKNKLKGFSLVELIIAIGIFTMAISSFAFLGIESYRTLRISQTRIIASEKTREISDLIMLIKNESWKHIVDNTTGGEKYVFIDIDGNLSIENGQEEGEGYVYSFTINPAYRNELGVLVQDGGEEDPFTRVIDLTILFENQFFGTTEYNEKIYTNNWNTRRLLQSTEQDFAGGSSDGTEVFEEGEIKLSKKFFPDWCLPQHTHSRHSLHWWTIGTALAASGNDAYVVTTEFFLGRSTFLHAKITPDYPPQVNIEAEYDLGPGNDVHVQDDYVYIATNSGEDSIRIMDVSEKPYTQVGSYGTNSSNDANAIDVSGEHGFVGYGNSIDIFDLSQQDGSRNKLSSISFGSSSARVRDIVVGGNYIFVGLENYNSQLAVIDISDINNPVIVSEIRVSNQHANSIAVSEDLNTVYLATTDNRIFFPARPRFVIIDTTNKQSLVEISSTLMTELRRINDMVVVEDKAIIGGGLDFSSGNNYVVLDINDLNFPVRCGGLRIPWGVRAFDTVRIGERPFTYILSLDPSYELQIVEGGGGGGGVSGEGYVGEGEYVSKILDLETLDARLYGINVLGQEPQGTSLKIWLKIGQTEDLSGASWFGPNGTENTHFNLGENEINLPDKQGQFFQYKVEMTSEDPGLSPVLDQIEIIYD